MLKPYASHPQRSRGRRIAEPAVPTRDDFQRDRDRIVHSTAFRRLVYKTQVFLNHEGDLFRTRLTHSLEVAQLGRSMARALGLNEDLVEAIALAHDLGHTPFGHAGQDALDACLKRVAGADSGFEHNLQSLRVVDALELRYPAFDGLNLSFETREGVLKHCSRRHAQALEAAEPGGVGQRFIAGTRPGLEAQLCDLADEIAYNAHDIDDGVRAGLITMAQLGEVPLVARFRDEALAEFPALEGRRLLYETIRRLLSQCVYDVIDSSAAALANAAPVDADAARRLPPLVLFSAEMRDHSALLKRFLRVNLYRHPQVVDVTQRAQQVVRELFEAYLDAPGAMPGLPPETSPEPPAALASASARAHAHAHARRRPKHRVVADYIAGMTDRFALKEHQRLTGRVLF